MGANGQGKTNLLESVAMLALSASPRSRREVELVGPVAPMSRIEAQVESRGITAELAITLTVESERARRVIEVDGIRRRAFDLPGHFRVTLFWPDDLGLVKAGPELRRRFLNQMLVQIEPGYGRALAGLKRVLEQRNSLLKRIAGGEESGDVLDVWDQELIQRCWSSSRKLPEATPRSRLGRAWRSAMKGLRRTWRKLCITPSPRTSGEVQPLSARIVTIFACFWAEKRPGPMPPRASRGPRW
jgi:DNA replication and repair protein RecF